MYLVSLKHKIILQVSLLLFIIPSVFAQPLSSSYRNPLNLPISLSANFAEIRPNHFHSGLDFRVGGAAGAKLYAVEDGYIARINISPYGYGKALYINHPNGQTSVYGHLDGFSEQIRKYVETLQYNRQNFAFDDTVSSDALPVKKGELIGYAGNSGSSFGAHLHFEIRHTANQMPINIISRGIYKVTDDVSPTIHQMAVFTLDSVMGVTMPRLLKAHKVVKKDNVFVPEGDEIVEVCNPVYFGVWANDYQPNNTSKQGVYRMTAYYDEQPFWNYALDGFLFEETRYINSFIAYEELVKNKRSIVKTYVEPNNQLSIYHNVVNNGLLVLNDTLPHTIKMELFDDNGNKTTLNFRIKKSDKVSGSKMNILDPDKFRSVLWNQSFTYTNEGLKVTIPEKSLYSNTLFSINSSTTNGLYAPLWNIGNPAVPLQKRIEISVLAKVPGRLKAKAVVVSANKEGKITGSAGGTWDNDGFLNTTVSEFGTYSVAIDTVAPTVKTNFKSGANMGVKQTLTVTIADNLSGIATYNGYIDGQWALFDYDAKTRSLNYRFDASRIKKGKRHTLKVIVEDGCKNSATFTTEFIW